MRTRYFVRGTIREPFYVFRILPGMRVQVYDVAGHSWQPAPIEPLYRWAIIDGEMGVDEIREATAQQIIDDFHRRVPPLPRIDFDPADPALHRLDGPDAPDAPRYSIDR